MENNFNQFYKCIATAVTNQAADASGLWAAKNADHFRASIGESSSGDQFLSALYWHEESREFAFADMPSLQYNALRALFKEIDGCDYMGGDFCSPTAEGQALYQTIAGACQ